jgi:hypothetical protein
MGQSLFQRIRTDYGLSVCDWGNLDRRSRPTKAVELLSSTQFVIHCERMKSLNKKN